MRIGLWWNFDAAYYPVGGRDWLPPPGIGVFLTHCKGYLKSILFYIQNCQNNEPNCKGYILSILFYFLTCQNNEQNGIRKVEMKEVDLFHNNENDIVNLINHKSIMQYSS